MENDSPYHPSSPQAKQMADESMVRNLAAQAEAIWPQEEAIFDRHPIGTGEVLDVGCGTGEVIVRLAAKYPDATFVGIDVETAHLERARTRCQAYGDRVRFEYADALAMPYPDATFDYVICRHVLQAVPDATAVLAEIRRVLKPGGRAHLLAEDYGMLWCHPTELGSDGFWQTIPPQFAAAVGCDLQVGRKMFTHLHDARWADVFVEYLTIDTIRVPREIFARIWEAWRDGYADSIVEAGFLSPEESMQRWQQMTDCVRDPRGYALWHVPVWTAMKPTD